jgi:hypothetical protein
VLAGTRFGRAHEQTFVSDQDNGLMFSATDRHEADALRELFLPFAQDVNRRLADCGFPLCSGGIMAGNPAWCLSLDEWKQQFIEWVRRPEPEALLNASIFFDLHPLFGDRDLGEALRQLLLSLTRDNPAFLHLMAANALQAPVPLNFRGESWPARRGKRRRGRSQEVRQPDLRRCGADSSPWRVAFAGGQYKRAAAAMPGRPPDAGSDEIRGRRRFFAHFAPAPGASGRRRRGGGETGNRVRWQTARTGHGDPAGVTEAGETTAAASQVKLWTLKKRGCRESQKKRPLARQKWNLRQQGSRRVAGSTRFSSSCTRRSTR